MKSRRPTVTTRGRVLGSESKMVRRPCGSRAVTISPGDLWYRHSRARSAWNREPDRIDMVRTRTQIHEGKKITLNYRDEHGRDSQRTIWPIAVGYHEAVRILAAWCELRKDFRSFRTDRVVDAVYHDEKYPERRDILRAKWRRSLVWEAPKDT